MKTFTSNELQKVDVDSESIVSSHLQELINVSNDINLLEEKLKKAAIPFPFIYIFDYISSRNRNHYYECLVWGKDSNGNYRLSHNVYYLEYAALSHLDKDSRRRDIAKLIGSKPVIETKSSFRLKIKNHLPFFYKEIINSLKTESTIGFEVVFKAPHISAIPLPQFIDDLPF